ncbi:MAG TPA: DNA polymerase [Pyrinomonadaceae bacterium]|jgi:DNA polymerase I-like protein with 3'-5' exonuclease and polymerase domains
MEVYYQHVTNADDLRHICEEFSKLQAVGLDTETTDLDPYKGELRLIQLAAAADNIKLIDLRNFPDPKTNPDLDCLRDLLFSNRPTKVLHNAKFDAKWLRFHLGAELGGVFDTLLGSQIIAAGETDRRHNLADVTQEFLGVELDKSQQVSDWSAAELSSVQLEYGARDAAIVLPLREKMIERFKQDALLKVAQLEFECVMPVAMLELNGINIDPARWREQLAKVKKDQLVIADELQDLLAGGIMQGSLFGRPEINLDSHTQLTDALKRLGVPLPETTRNWQLEPLANDYPVVKKLIEYRTVAKAISSYGESFLEYINPKTGRIHADFRQIGAPTGRFSCNNPNIQQVPHGEVYRRCFRAPEGRKLVISDYSQIELRILADFTGDEGFVSAFNSGQDLHKSTASQIFNVPIDAVTSDQRSFAKRINFGVVYGIGAQRVANLTGISIDEARSLLSRYFQTYPRLDAWLRDAAIRATRERQARTASGRLARFRFDPEDRQAVSLAERNGKNTPIQGTSADILKRALRLLHEELRGTSTCLVNIIHDEIVVETDAADAEKIVECVERAMCQAGEEYVKKVPVKVESVIADEWLK